MGEMIQLTASDGHQLSAYRADPDGTVKGGVVIVQEIFGITGHIQEVANQYAGHGYLAIAPAMFDRIRTNALFDYSDVEQARGFMLQLDPDDAEISYELGVVHAIGHRWQATSIGAASVTTGGAKVR